MRGLLSTRVSVIRIPLISAGGERMPIRLLLSLAATGGVFVTACDLGPMPVRTSEPCAQAGSQCQLPEGPLGVCERAQCASGETAPCFKCTSQH